MGFARLNIIHDPEPQCLIDSLEVYLPWQSAIIEIAITALSTKLTNPLKH